MIKDTRFRFPLFNPSYRSFSSKGTHTPHLFHLLFDKNKFSEDLGTAAFLHRIAVFQCSQNYIWIIRSTNHFNTIHTMEKTTNLAQSHWSVNWCVTPGSVTVHVYFALGKFCPHRTWVGKQRSMGQEWWLLGRDASTLNKPELCGLHLWGQAELRKPSPRATAVLSSVS